MEIPPQELKRLLVEPRWKVAASGNRKIRQEPQPNDAVRRKTSAGTSSVNNQQGVAGMLQKTTGTRNPMRHCARKTQKPRHRNVPARNEIEHRSVGRDSRSRDWQRARNMWPDLQKLVGSHCHDHGVTPANIPWGTPCCERRLRKNPPKESPSPLMSRLSP